MYVIWHVHDIHICIDCRWIHIQIYLYHICSIYRIVYFMYRIYFILHINPLHRLFNLFMYNLQHSEICCTIHVIATPTCVATIPSVSSSIPSLIRTVFWQLSAIFSMDEEKLSDRNARLNKCHFGTHVDPVCVCVSIAVCIFVIIPVQDLGGPQSQSQWQWQTPTWWACTYHKH